MKAWSELTRAEWLAACRAAVEAGKKQPTVGEAEGDAILEERKTEALWLGGKP